MSLDEAPVPSLLKYALTLLGIEAYGPIEKGPWWVSFTYRHERCTPAHEQVARVLGMSRAILHRRIRELPSTVR